MTSMRLILACTEDQLCQFGLISAHFFSKCGNGQANEGTDEQTDNRNGQVESIVPPAGSGIKIVYMLTQGITFACFIMLRTFCLQ